MSVDTRPASTPAHARVSSVVIGWRMVRGLAQVLLGVLICVLLFPWLSQARRAPVVSWWARGFIAALGLRLRVQGRWPDAPGRYLLTSNHISWLDIFVIHAVKPVRFVSKSEVRHWPVAGFLATSAGTLYVDRNRKRDTLDIGAQMQAVMDAGEPVGIFPEGTTSDGTVLLPFFSPLLQPAVRSTATLVPTGVRYRRPDGRINTDLAFIGEQTFLESVRITLRQPATEAEVRFGALIPSDGLHRRELTARAEAAVATLLGVAVDPGWQAPGDHAEANRTPRHARGRRASADASANANANAKVAQEPTGD